jgi:hypothetical protein
VTNYAICLVCGDKIVSTHRHDFKLCSCGNVAVDGGNEYKKMNYSVARWIIVPDDDGVEVLFSNGRVVNVVTDDKTGYPDLVKTVCAGIVAPAISDDDKGSIQLARNLLQRNKSYRALLDRLKKKLLKSCKIERLKSFAEDILSVIDKS